MTADASLQNAIRRKLVIIGDGGCGKSSLLSVFALGYFPTDDEDRRVDHYKKIPTVFDNYVTDCIVDGKAVHLSLWDTAGQESYERLRPLTYSTAHVLLISFSIDSTYSLENVKSKWIKEASRLCAGIPIILVGLKSDLQKDKAVVEEMYSKSILFATKHDGEAVAREIGAKKYLECSSLSGEGIDEVFEAATRAALLPSDKGECECGCVVL